MSSNRAAGWLEAWKLRMATEIETAGGRHDEPEIYGGEPGDPGLAGGPGSVSWEIHGDLASVVVAGTAAIIMEILHPSVMAGVFTHSSYRTDPLRRARNTLAYVLRTTFGNTAAATRVIEGVKRVHGRVEGARPDGVAYRALDPELIGWVHTCIPWAVMTAYDRYTRPLSTPEKNRYLAEQALIGRMGGADWVPETVAELDDYVERVRPQLAMNEQTRSFFDFLGGRTEDLVVGRRERFDRWASIRASMSLMPEWARRLTGAVERTVVLCRGPHIDVDDLPEQVHSFIPNRPTVASNGDEDRPMPLEIALEAPERRIIERALQRNAWNRQQTAAELNINRTTLYKKMRKYKLDIGESN